MRNKKREDHTKNLFKTFLTLDILKFKFRIQFKNELKN